MDLLMIPVPFFDRELAVQAYYIRYRRGNGLLDANQVTVEFDGAMQSPLLQIINEVGVDAFTGGKPLFVPINSLMLLAGLDRQYRRSPEKIVFVLSNDVKVEPAYLDNIRALKQQGFRFAAQKLPNLRNWSLLLAECDYLFLNNQLSGQEELIDQARREHRHLKLIMTHINTHELFEALPHNKLDLYEGRFYRVPITQQHRHVISPLKANLINLMNTVGNEDFEFSSVSRVVERDTALSVSLLRMINSPYIGLREKVKSIQHAVTLLGQEQVRKWATTAVSKQLGADKPDEITKLSLVRAKFYENLAPLFKQQRDASSLFLTGLFSVLDVILDQPMEQALNLVHVSDDIREALLHGKGPYSDIADFVAQYERANWQQVSRQLIVHDLTPDDVSTAYTNAIGWYRDLIGDEESKIVPAENTAEEQSV